MKRILYGIVAGIIFYGVSCAPKPPSKTTKATYSEDLSEYRPSLEVDQQELIDKPVRGKQNYPDPSNDITRDLNSLLAKAAQHNADENFVQGFTIIIPNSSRQEASQTRQKIYELDHSLKPQMEYEPPSWKVKVGQYYTRLEAQKTFSMLKKEIPKALLVPDKIPIQ